MATAEGTREREIKRKMEKERKSFTTRLIAQRGTESLFASWQLEVSRVRTRWLRGSLVPVATCPRVPVSRQMRVLAPCAHPLYLSLFLPLTFSLFRNLTRGFPSALATTRVYVIPPPSTRQTYIYVYVCMFLYVHLHTVLFHYSKS